MKKVFKFLAGFLTCILVFTGVACNKDKDDDSKTETNNNGCGTGTMTLEDLNKMLNDSTNMDMNEANHIEIIPFNHVNGPKKEWAFYALVNFEFDKGSYVRYQVTYLSCTCRDAEVNYWSTAYIELTKPDSGLDEDIALQMMSFDEDGTGHYTAGFWGDSSPIYSGNNIVATYDRVDNGEGGYYPSIKYDFIPKLVGKTKAEIDTWKYYTDMNDPELSVFSGASVSTNNIIRIIQATMAYHAERYL